MAVTSAMRELFDKLYNDTATQNQYRANPSFAVADYDLTAHERDAIVTKDLDDLVELGLADSVAALPEVLRGTRVPGPSQGGGWGWLASIVENARRAAERLPFELPRPSIPRPGPRPRPGPPGPRPEPNPPGPRPGPDPPGPDN